jgi:hypothetical protein
VQSYRQEFLSLERLYSLEKKAKFKVFFTVNPTGLQTKETLPASQDCCEDEIHHKC